MSLTGLPSQGTTPTAILDNLRQLSKMFIEATPFGGGRKLG
jgi:hypothetical protein